MKRTYPQAFLSGIDTTSAQRLINGAAGTQWRYGNQVVEAGTVDVEALQQIVQDLIAAIGSVDISDLSAKVDTIESTLANLPVFDEAAINTRITAVENDVENLNDYNLNSRTSDLEGDVSTLNAQDLDSRINALVTQISTLQTNLTTYIDSNDVKLSKVQTRIMTPLDEIAVSIDQPDPMQDPPYDPQTFTLKSYYDHLFFLDMELRSKLQTRFFTPLDNLGLQIAAPPPPVDPPYDPTTFTLTHYAEYLAQLDEDVRQLIETTESDLDARITPLESVALSVPAFNPQSEKTITYTGPFNAAGETLTFTYPVDFLPEKTNLLMSDVSFELFAVLRAGHTFPNFIVNLSNSNTWRDTDSTVNRGFTLAQNPTQTRQFQIITSGNLVAMIGQTYLFWNDIVELRIKMKAVSLVDQLSDLSIGSGGGSGGGGTSDVSRAEFDSLSNTVSTINSWKTTATAQIASIQTLNSTQTTQINNAKSTADNAYSLSEYAVEQVGIIQGINTTQNTRLTALEAKSLKTFGMQVFIREGTGGLGEPVISFIGYLGQYAARYWDYITNTYHIVPWSDVHEIYMIAANEVDQTETFSGSITTGTVTTSTTIGHAFPAASYDQLNIQFYIVMKLSISKPYAGDILVANKQLEHIYY